MSVRHNYWLKMAANVVNQTPYLRSARNYPDNDLSQMAVEMNRSWVDIALAVNNRTISIFPTSRPAVNGEDWFLTGNKKQQGFRQAYSITSTASIPHGIQIVDPAQFVRCFGGYTDGTNSYGLIWGTSVAVAGLTTFYVTSTNIVFLVGAGAPALTSGTVVLEWLSQP